MKTPKDLGLKIGTPEEVFWTEVKKKMESDIESSKRNIVINTHVLELAEKKIAEEKKVLNRIES